MSPGAIALAFLGLLGQMGFGQAEDARQSFDKAVQYELHGGQAASLTAYALYLHAAQAGVPEAQFNVAVLLDSGRGGLRDVSLAATWYARAAAHGHSRAAFNLGQLYETGDGVARNTDLARAWYVASNLPAALARAKRLAAPSASGALTPADLVAPRPGDDPSTETGLAEFVWTSAQQPGAVEFLIEICAIEQNEAHEIFSARTALSSVAVLLPEGKPRLAWHVTTIAPASQDYRVSAWVYFGGFAAPVLTGQRSDRLQH